SRGHPTLGRLAGLLRCKRCSKRCTRDRDLTWRIAQGCMEYLRSYLSHAGFIPSVALVLIFYALLRAMRNSMWRIALLSLPGTIAHELAHFVVGLVLLAKPRGFSIWPRAHAHTWTLGSVSFGNIGLLNGAFVALAPLLLLPIAWLC